MDRNIVSRRDVDGERERREAAQRHKGEVVAGSGTPLTPYEQRAYDSAEYWHAEALSAQAALKLIVSRHPSAERGEHPAVDIARDALGTAPSSARHR